VKHGKRIFRRAVYPAAVILVSLCLLACGGRPARNMPAAAAAQGMTPAEFIATLEYTFDRHLAGNRSPMTVGLHSELYTIKADGKTDPAVIRARRAAVEAFLAYALAKPEVRLVNHRELLGWLKNPALLR
jgi:hypothetical protein